MNYEESYLIGHCVINYSFVVSSVYYKLQWPWLKVVQSSHQSNGA